MRIRSQLEAFSQQIDQCSEGWNGTQSIHLAVPIKEEVRQIDSLLKRLKTLSAYKLGVPAALILS